MPSVEDELEAALRDIDSDDDARQTPVEQQELDFGGKQADDDWFAKERAQERAEQAKYQQQQTSRNGPPLGEQILAARFAEGRSLGETLSPMKRIGIVVGAAATLLIIILSTSTPHKIDSVKPASVGHLFDDGASGTDKLRALTHAPPQNSLSIILSNTGCSPLPCPEKINCIPDLDVDSAVVSIKPKSNAEAADVALVIQSYAPSTNTMKRVIKIANEIKSSKTSVHLWLSLDETNSHNGTSLLIKEIENLKLRLRPGADIRLHEFTTDAMVKRYPVLRGKLLSQANGDKSIQNKWKYGKIKKKGMRPGGFLAPNEALMLWHQNSEVKTLKYKYVWVIDDLTLFSGDITDFLKSYESLSADLITESGCAPAKNLRNIAGGSIMSESFKKYFQNGVQVSSKDYIQRFSSQMLAELDVCSSKHVTALGQGQAACALANKAGLSIEPLSRSHIGNPFDDKNVRQESQATDQGKLYHPIK